MLKLNMYTQEVSVKWTDRCVSDVNRPVTAWSAAC